MFKKLTSLILAITLFSVVAVSSLGSTSAYAAEPDMNDDGISFNPGYGEIKEYSDNEVAEKARTLLNPDNQSEYLINANYVGKFWRRICVRWVWVPQYLYLPYPPFFRVIWRKICTRWVWVPVYYPIAVLPPDKCLTCPVERIPVKDLIINPNDPLLKNVKLDQDVFQKPDLDKLREELAKEEMGY
jgi:hypothetical protein